MATKGLAAISVTAAMLFAVLATARADSPSPVYVIPTPTATPPPSSSLVLLIFAVRSPRLHGRTLSWTVRCLPHACRARFSLRVEIGRHRLAHGHVSRYVPATRDLRVAVRLSPATRDAIHRAWHRHRRVVVVLRAGATDARNHAAGFRFRRRLRR